MYLTDSYFCSSNNNKLVAVSYESLFFGKSFKTPFAATLVSMLTIYHHFAGAVAQPPDRMIYVGAVVQPPDRVIMK
jgi:hypothetical protein